MPQFKEGEDTRERAKQEELAPFIRDYGKRNISVASELLPEDDS